MREAAADLNFEEAARLRDEIKRLRATELAVVDDPTARTIVATGARRAPRKPGLDEMGPGVESIPGKGKAGPRSTSGRPGTRAWRGTSGTELSGHRRGARVRLARRPRRAASR